MAWRGLWAAAGGGEQHCPNHDELPHGHGTFLMSFADEIASWTIVKVEPRAGCKTTAAFSSGFRDAIPRARSRGQPISSISPAYRSRRSRGKAERSRRRHSSRGSRIRRIVRIMIPRRRVLVKHFPVVCAMSIAVFVMWAAPSVAFAQSDNQWKVDVAPLYFWASTTDGNIAINGTRNIPVYMDFADAKSKLAGAFSFHGEARRGRWGILGDINFIRRRPIPTTPRPSSPRRSPARFSSTRSSSTGRPPSR